MSVRNIILSLFLALSFISCGTQKAVESCTDEGPLIRTKFYGAKFEDSPFRVGLHISQYQPIKRVDGSYVITDQQFVGYSWHYVQMKFVEKMLYIVNFQQEYRKESDALCRFDSICSMLRMKYGDLESTDNGNTYSFTDAHYNTVSITVHYGTSEGGEDYWYCELTYCWGPGILINMAKSLDEI